MKEKTKAGVYHLENPELLAPLYELTMLDG
jgi:hypothetical protein